jgi:hypothetical protein
MNAANSLDLDAALAGAGAPAATFAQLSESLWSQPYVSAQMLELCRLTLARLHRDELELSARNPHLRQPVPAAQRAAVLAGRTRASGLFTPAEVAILDFAETYGLDAQALTDEMAADVREASGEPGLVFLIEALGLLDARIRSARCLRDLADGATRRG